MSVIYGLESTRRMLKSRSLILKGSTVGFSLLGEIGRHRFGLFHERFVTSAC